jgi:hypothetical protein
MQDSTYFINIEASYSVNFPLAVISSKSSPPLLNALLSTLTAAGTFTDLTIAAPYLANTVVSGLNTNALFVKVNTASGNNNTVNFAVFGDVVTF